MGSLRLGKYFRFNMSRSGVSLSGGVKGFRLSVGPRGIKRSVTVPGTGYTSTKTLISFKKGRKKSSTSSTTQKTKQKMDQLEPSTVGQLEDDWVLHLAKRKTGFGMGLLLVVVGLIGWWLLPKFNAVGLVILTIGLLIGALGLFTNKAKAVKHMNKAVREFDREHYETAVKALVKAHELVPKDEEVIYYLGVIHYVYLEDYNDALYYFNLLDIKGLTEDMKLAIADCCYESEDYDTSIMWLNSFKFTDEEDMERLTLLAKNHMKKHDYVLAEEILKANVGNKRKMTPYLIEAKYWLGVLYLKLGDAAKAKQHLMKVYLEDGDFEDIAVHMDELGLLEVKDELKA